MTSLPAPAMPAATPAAAGGANSSVAGPSGGKGKKTDQDLFAVLFALQLAPGSANLAVPGSLPASPKPAAGPVAKTATAIPAGLAGALPKKPTSKTAAQDALAKGSQIVPATIPTLPGAATLPLAQKTTATNSSPALGTAVIPTGTLDPALAQMAPNQISLPTTTPAASKSEPVPSTTNPTAATPAPATDVKPSVVPNPLPQTAVQSVPKQVSPPPVQVSVSSSATVATAVQGPAPSAAAAAVAPHVPAPSEVMLEARTLNQLNLVSAPLSVAGDSRPAETERRETSSDASTHSEQQTPATVNLSTDQTAGPAPTPAPQHAALNADKIVDTIRAHQAEAQRNGRVDLHLELNPPDLGRVRIQLTAKDHELSARLIVEQDSARQLIATQVDSLRSRLSALGITLGQFDVRRDGGGSQFQQQQEQPAPSAAPVSATKAAPASVSRTSPGPVSARSGIDVIA